MQNSTEDNLYLIQVTTPKGQVSKVYDTQDLNEACFNMMWEVYGEGRKPQYDPSTMYISRLAGFSNSNGFQAAFTEIYGEKSQRNMRTIVVIRTNGIVLANAVDTVDLRYAIRAAFSALYARTQPIPESDLPNIPGSLLGAFKGVAMYAKRAFTSDLPLFLNVLTKDSPINILNIQMAMAPYLVDGYPLLSVYVRRSDYETYHRLSNGTPLDLFTQTAPEHTPVIEIERSTCDAYIKSLKVNGVYAEIHDFGGLANTAGRVKNTCGNVAFTPRPASQFVLRKYNISYHQFVAITQELVKELSTGMCDKCARDKN